MKRKKKYIYIQNKYTVAAASVVEFGQIFKRKKQPSSGSMPSVYDNSTKEPKINTSSDLD